MPMMAVPANTVHSTSVPSGFMMIIEADAVA